MALQPIGHRVLVQPDEAPEATDSGIVLPQDRDHVPVSGVIVAVGSGPARDQKIRTATIARCIGIVEDLSELHDTNETISAMDDVLAEMRRYLGQLEKYTGSLTVGDRVVYPVDAGLKLTEDGREYILLNEDDVVVIATEEEAAA